MSSASLWIVCRDDKRLIINIMGHLVEIEDIRIGHDASLVLIAGPCVIEDFDTTFHIASYLKNLTQAMNVPFIF